MKHILVPIGSSENASNTLQYAIDVASEFAAKVYVFRAYKVLSKAGTMISIDEIVAKETNLYLRSIVNTIDTKDIDLIIAGPKSNSIREEVFLGSTSGSIVKQMTIPTLIVPEGYQFKPFNRALIAFQSGVLKKKNMLLPLYDFITKFKTTVNLLLVKTPEYKEEDLILDSALKTIQNTLTISENSTIFQGVLEHFRSNNPDLLRVFRRKRGFFQKLWEKNTVLKSEFYTTIPLLVLCGRQ